MIIGDIVTIKCKIIGIEEDGEREYILRPLVKKQFGNRIFLTNQQLDEAKNE